MTRDVTNNVIEHHMSDHMINDHMWDHMINEVIVIYAPSISSDQGCQPCIKGTLS